MSNLYDIERFVDQRRQEIDDRVSHELLLRQLHHRRSSPQRPGQPALRVRFGLMLVRLGSRLAA